MKKISAVLSLVLLGIFLTAATAFAKEAKVQLHDEITLDAFVAKYNEISDSPITDYSTHSTRGDYEAYVATVDESNAMLINVNGTGHLSNILLMHRGEITEADQKKLMSMFACLNVALGYPATEDGMAFLTEAFHRLEITSPKIMASRLQRSDIQRDYTFLKSENGAQKVHVILVEAVAE